MGRQVWQKDLFHTQPQEKLRTTRQLMHSADPMKKNLLPSFPALSYTRLLALSFFLALCTSASAASGTLEDLVGTWVRPDGGYKLVVKSIGADGKADVQYFNPNPIRVAEANAALKDGDATLFVKFDDVNYTGSTYNLALSSDKSRLVGKYYQAIQRQTYDIFFDRQP